MTLDLDAIEARAKAATPGPWTSTWDDSEDAPETEDVIRGPAGSGEPDGMGDAVVGLFRYDGHHVGCTEANAAHIAGCDPDTVLAMVAEIRRLREFARDCRDNWDCDFDGHTHGTTCRVCAATDLDALRTP